MGESVLGGIDVDDLQFFVTMACVLVVGAFAAVGVAMMPFRSERDRGAGYRWARR
ncbi:hypothetical protein [Bradyrhizobium lablabi]|uniref:hypothetical protein n=1 Tax=Bradyrhizobium lablabi TaxID=722472 RepID=UPI001BAE0511|nr:hypothetical protein [Bradyrhizobium lablabi]MBR0695975.1 hypothetical protein [Bradyrhizobium lablabi]